MFDWDSDQIISAQPQINSSQLISFVSGSGVPLFVGARGARGALSGDALDFELGRGVLWWRVSKLAISMREFALTAFKIGVPLGNFCTHNSPPEYAKCGGVYSNASTSRRRAH